MGGMQEKLKKTHSTSLTILIIRLGVELQKTHMVTISMSTKQQWQPFSRPLIFLPLLPFTPTAAFALSLMLNAVKCTAQQLVIKMQYAHIFD